MSVGPAKPFQRHLGQHLQELALFALPRSSPDENNESDTSTNPEQLEEVIQHIMLDDLDESVLDDFDELDTSAKPPDSSHSSHLYDAQETVDREYITMVKYGSGCSYGSTFLSQGSLIRHMREEHTIKCPCATVPDFDKIA
jgi:hypothetical protein